MALGTITETWQQSICRRTDEWIKKMGYIYTMKYYSVMKNEKMPCPATGKKVGIIILREARETGKEKYHVISLLCGLYRWIHINFFTKER